MESISLWHCSGVMRAQVALIVAFSSSALLGLAYPIFLFTIPHRFSMGLRSGEFAGQLRTGIPWSSNQVLVSRRKHEVLQNFLVYGCVDLGPQKTQWTNTRRWHGTPNHHWLWKLYTGPQATWILCLSSRPPDSGTLISKGNAKCTFIREHNFGPLSSSPVLFVFSPGETLLTLSVVQEWLDTRKRQLKPMSCIRLCVVVLEALTPAAVHSLWISPTFLNGFCFTILSRVRLSLLLVHFFLPHLFLPFASLLMCLDTELCEQPASFAMTFCVLPSLCKVSMVLFWTTVKSAVFPMIV